MSEDPRFVCRREGHVPMLEITSQNVTTGDEPFVYVTTCKRCGKAFEVRELPHGNPTGEQASEK